VNPTISSTTRPVDHDDGLITTEYGPQHVLQGVAEV